MHILLCFLNTCNFNLKLIFQRMLDKNLPPLLHLPSLLSLLVNPTQFQIFLHHYPRIPLVTVITAIDPPLYKWRVSIWDMLFLGNGGERYVIPGVVVTVGDLDKEGLQVYKLFSEGWLLLCWGCWLFYKLVRSDGR